MMFLVLALFALLGSSALRERELVSGDDFKVMFTIFSPQSN